MAHGLALVFHKLFTKYIKIKDNRITQLLGIILTFHFVGICWIFFRSTSFHHAFYSIHEIFTKTSWIDLQGFWISRPEIIYLLIIASVIVFIPGKLKNLFFLKEMSR